jgi:hypothetical protein
MEDADLEALVDVKVVSVVVILRASFSAGVHQS